MIKTILLIVAVGVLIVAFGLVTNEGLKRTEWAECQQWVRDSQQYQDWYSTDWQREQCLTFGIELK